MSMLEKSKISDKVIAWNNRWKYDYWFRKKYGIPFNSKKHRELSPLDTKFAYEEEVMMENYMKLKRQEELDLKQYKETGRLLKERRLPDAEEEKLYDLIDIDKY